MNDDEQLYEAIGVDTSPPIHYYLIGVGGAGGEWNMLAIRDDGSLAAARLFA